MINRVLRALGGAGAGLLAGLCMATLTREPLESAFAGILLGTFISLCFQPDLQTYLESAITGGAIGFPVWSILVVVISPLLHGLAPAWSAAGMRSHFQELVEWVILGALTGLFCRLAFSQFPQLAGKGTMLSEPSPIKRILILGGGFGGAATAGELERVFGADQGVEITLVSETNALLFTPMLAEVAGSSLEPTHISSPLRTSLRRTRVIRGEVKSIDLESRKVGLSLRGSSLASTPEGEGTLAYDHLVLALGSISNYFGNENVRLNSFDFKTLLDAIRIRNHVIDMFEQAERESDSLRRRQLLRFVIAGGGFAGVELAGALNDFARGMAADYLEIDPAEIEIILIHARERILPELSAPLGDYALRRMTERGVTFRLGSRVADARPGVVVLSPDEEIQAETLVWTAGTAPNPLLKSLAVEKNGRGAIVVDDYLQIPSQPNCWALGDCAGVTDSRTREACPPTAQFALREARTLAYNIHASMLGQKLKPFHFDSLGSLCVVGFQTACAELTIPFFRKRKVQFSGLFAWLLWRGIYLSKLPGIERKVRVLIDWIIEVFFPRDIVQTIDLDGPSGR